MVFSSIMFLSVFLPITLLIYHLTPARFRNYVALVASLFFYSWGAPRFVFVLIGTSAIDYAISRHLHPEKGHPHRLVSRRLLLTVAIALNVGLFLYFKYMNFFVDQFNVMLACFGGSPAAWTRIALPIGISFFTFQKLSYLVDVYRGAGPPAPSFAQHLLYVVLFPQLIAGPIVRYHDVAAQLIERTCSSEKTLEGLWRFALGLAKKVLIANVVGSVADHAFGTGSGLSIGGAWLGATCYAWQIYFDFSGYSDMAIGLGRMLGFDFLENFRAPYIAANFTEFWRRWHISLSNWMREYLYIPLGGNRGGRLRRDLNLWVVFLLSGFWHGAAWNFIVWGLYHGLFLSLDKVTTRWRERIARPVAVITTFVLVVVGWIFFRAESLGDAGAYLGRMVGMGSGGGTGLPLEIMTPQVWLAFAIAAVFSFLPLWLPTLETCDWTTRRSGPMASLPRTLTTALLLATSFMTLVNGGFNPFIYFRF
ncbi:MAG: MBOAT family protein [Verrucomicrobia bacterium]|jgi:alginate O-acetyltransferase complex protein AlgI|nr:MBOAT family protein [Verrucomicrobiota bacterium]MBT7065634.1 MBOAT family protein [Verrucomicrobiota bacterium]MBT7699791.1 MBOAT family protein [Verrucomicrobiota bacterium]